MSSFIGALGRPSTIGHGDEEFADQTKDIVIERAHRRLQRSERDLKLRKADLANLQDRTIPVELTEHRLKVEAQERELEKLERDIEATRLSKRIAIMSAEFEVTRLQAELADLLEDDAQEEKE